MSNQKCNVCGADMRWYEPNYWGYWECPNHCKQRPDKEVAQEELVEYVRNNSNVLDFQYTRNFIIQHKHKLLEFLKRIED